MFAYYRIGFYLTFLDNSLTTTRSEESVHESWAASKYWYGGCQTWGLTKLDLYEGSGLRQFLRTMREYFSRRIINKGARRKPNETLREGIARGEMR